VIVSQHLCGLAIAYVEQSGGKKKLIPSPGRAQGSLISYQKRQIADAVCFLGQHHTHGARIFVATTSNHWDTSDEKLNVSRFCHTLRNGYGMGPYCWVREYNAKGSPHFHFVADLPWQEPDALVKMSLYWSSIFGERADNCVRFGSKPFCPHCAGPLTSMKLTPTHTVKDFCRACNQAVKPKRLYEITNMKHAFYLSAYLGKDKGKARSNENTGRSFAISQSLAAFSKPISYQVNYSFRHEEREVMTTKGMQKVELAYPTGTTIKENYNGMTFNKTDYEWKRAKDHQVWFGRLRERKNWNSSASNKHATLKKKPPTLKQSHASIAGLQNTYGSPEYLNSLLL